jgi:hypothetical protein
MPWEVKKSNQCPPQKPWGVFNQITGRKVACHATRAQAVNQQKALYANVPESRKKMSEFTAVKPIQFSEPEGDILWVEALYPKKFQTTQYGEVIVTKDKLENFVKNFHQGIRGQEIATDFEHGLDKSKGQKASGWIKDVKIADEDILMVGFEPTPPAREEIENKEWKYFSLDWRDLWEDNDGVLHRDVIVGGGLTNNPIAKNMAPINFSELYEETQFAEKLKAPYGNVTYADPGYRGGKKRYPLDTERHIRAAWSYINVAKNAAFYTASQLSSIKARIKAAMRRIGAKVSMSEASDLTDEAIEKELNDNLMSEEEATKVIQATDEHADLEHMEPGGTPDPQTNEDDSFPSRHETLPADSPKTDEEGRPSTDLHTTEEDMEGKELDAKLRETLGLDENADIIKAVSDLKETAGPLEEVAKQFSERKQFAEAFPEQHEELEKLRKERIENKAIKFSESVGDMRFGSEQKHRLAPVVLEKVANLHKKFSERSATIDDFEDLMNAMHDEKALVEVGERGSDRTEEIKFTETDNPRKAFSEAVTAIMEQDELDYEAAVRIAAEKHPELAAAYQNTRVVG